MASASFPRALALVLTDEGGYSDNPADPGGATNRGITLATLQAWRGKPVSKDDVRNLTVEEAGSIYRARYWNIVHGDDLPAGVDYAVFDFAVNSGPGRAVEALQACLKVPADGSIGPQTLAALAGVVDSRWLIGALCDSRSRWLQSLPTFGTFGKGWTARVVRVRANASAMVNTTVPPAPAPAPQPKPIPAPVPKPAPKGFLQLVLDLIIAIFFKRN